MKRRALLAVPLVAAGVLSLSGCTLVDAITPPVESALYATTADAKGDNATLEIPSFVPDDAVMIRMKENTTTGDAILVFGDGAPEPIGQPCDPSIAGNLPRLNDTWWPQNLPTEGITCQDGWHIVVISVTQYFAWKP